MNKHEPSLRPSYPGYSLKERDRRWALARRLMDEEGLDGLLVAGQANRGAPNVAPDVYLSNDRAGGWLIFPRKGAPSLLSWNGMHILCHAVETKLGHTPWISPENFWPTKDPKNLKKVFEAEGLQSARIGIIGLDGGGPRLESAISQSAWENIQEALPNVKFVKVWHKFARMIVELSPEEIEVLKQCADAGERMSEAFVDAVKVGANETDVYSAVMAACVDAGANCSGFIIHSGPNTPAWGFPDWLVRPVRPRALQNGDIVQCELFPSYGTMETQQQVCVALGDVHPDHLKAAEVARQAYEVGLEKLRVGVSFGEVSEAMDAVVKGVGGWFVTPHIHSLNPIAIMAGLSSYGMDKFSEAGRYPPVAEKPMIGADIVIKAGMSFAFEPNCHLGDRRINIGGTVLATDAGPIELNEVANRMVMKAA
jgi:Xaa-Pro aminopeptidase